MRETYIKKGGYEKDFEGYSNESFNSDEGTFNSYLTTEQFFLS